MERTIQGVPLGGMLEADIVYSADENGWYADIYLLPSCKSRGKNYLCADGCAITID